MSSNVKVEGAPEFMEYYNSLDKTSDHFKELDGILDLLKQNPILGDSIRRELWPQKYITEHGIHCLFRIKMTDGWRLTYTISGTKKEKIVTVLEAFSHKDYEKRFGY